MTKKILSPSHWNAREAVYQALLSVQKQEGYVSDILERWKKQAKPAPTDYRLAQEIGYGTVRMAQALDCLALQLTERQKLDLKPKERLLLRMALYQSFYLSRVPIYAIADETMKLSKKYCHSSFSGFLNAMLRKLSSAKLSLPQEDNLADLSIRYSYPAYFVECLLAEQGLEKTKSILELGNTPSPTMVRLRPGFPLTSDLESVLTPLLESALSIYKVNEGCDLEILSQSKAVYLQNASPAVLLLNLCKHLDKYPQKILDLCASPGGKLIAMHDYYPHAKLDANDVSDDKIVRLAENCAKYEMRPSIYCGPGEEFEKGSKYDIVIIDAPCSNSGVLNKRPEARWRLNAQNNKELEKTQLKLLKHAATLLEEGGELWYMTCSILKGENEKIAKRACKELGLRLKWQESLLPDRQGWDGGFACALVF